jgi:Immune inhibitor A-like, MAM domain/FlgD Ig-like domain
MFFCLQRRSLLSLGFLVLFSIVATTAFAFEGARELANYEVSLPGPDGLHPFSSPQVKQQAEAGLPQWSLSWHGQDSGSLSGIGPVVTGMATEQFAESFISRQSVLLGISADEIGETGSQTLGHLEHRYYRQEHRGLGVIGSRLIFTFATDGTVQQFTTRTAPGITLTSVQPGVSADESFSAGFADLPGFNEIRLDYSELMVLPSLFSGLDGDRLVWNLYCTSMEPISSWRILVDATSGEVLERESLMTGLTAVSGVVSGTRTYPTPFDAEEMSLLGDMFVAALNGEELLGFTVTDGNGSFDLGEIDIPDSDNFALQAGLAGPWVTVLRHSPADMPATLTVPGTSFPANLVWSDEEATLAERSLFWNVNSAHSILKTMDPASQYLDRPVTVVALSDEGECNAYASLNPYAPFMSYYAAGDRCPNIGQITDVVYHEYAHLITMFTYGYDSAPGDFHEGFSDYFAATILDTCRIGLGFTGENTFLRDLDNDWTESSVAADEYCSGDVHCVGLLTGGALWKMRAALIEEIGDYETAVAYADRLYHFCRYGHPMDFDELLLHLRLLDDDDANLANGTPYLDAILTGFTHHEIGDLGVHLAHTPLFDTEDIATARTVAVKLSNVFPIVPEKIQVHYSVDGGGFVTEQMTGQIWDYSFDIPAPVSGDVSIRYYFTAEDTDGNMATLPATAPVDYFSYFMGVDVTPPHVSHSTPVAPAVNQSNIWFHADITDNSGVIGGVNAEVTIQKGDESTTQTVPLNFKTMPGRSNFYEGMLTVSDLGADDQIRYYLIAADEANETNQTRYPAIGEITMIAERGRSWDFETDLSGISTSGDWVLHNPPAIGPAAASGTGLVETDAGFGTGQYNVNVNSELITPVLDLSDWTGAQLVFDHWFQIEADWDGGQILCSSDGGESWGLLTPGGGYNGDIYDSWNLGLGMFPAYSSMSDAWEQVVVPLDFYIGESIQLKFLFWSDGGVIDLGWYLDNIKVIESQARVQPSAVYATSGDDTLVEVSWLPPDGVNVVSDAFLGYNLYRTAEGSESEFAKLNDSILSIPTYSDSEVSNGTYYNYVVTSVFTNGESPYSPVAIGYPYRAQLATAETAELTIEGDPVNDEESLVIDNSGTGNLNVNIYLADPDQSFSDVLPRFSPDGQPDIEFVDMISDDADASAPDVASISYQETQAGLLLFDFAFHDTMPDPEEGFTLIFSLDTDLDRSTGMPAGAAGAEYTLLMGQWAYEISEMAMGFRVPAIVIIGAYGMMPAPYLEMEADSDSLVVGMPSYLFAPGQPVGYSAMVEYGSYMSQQLAVDATVTTGEGKTNPVITGIKELATLLSSGALRTDENDEGDTIPDERESTWLSDTSPRFGTATPDEPLLVALDFDFTGEMEDAYECKLILTSNDPDLPTSEVSILVHLRDIVGEQMSCWSTESRSDGLFLEWAPAVPSNFPGGFELTRWTEAEDENSAILLTGAPITSPDDSLYSYLDRTALSGVAHYYRITGITSDGEQVPIDPVAHPLYDPAVPGKLVLQQALPNPLSTTTTLRLQAPAGRAWDLAICDVTGRMVRQLVEKGAYSDGIHMVQWDGRDTNGEMVSQGVYYAVMRSGGKQSTRSLVVVR